MTTMLSNVMDQLSSMVPSKLLNVKGEFRHTGLILAAAACAVLPLEISHLLSMIVGVLAYMLIQTLTAGVERAEDPVRKKQQLHPWSDRPPAPRRASVDRPTSSLQPRVAARAPRSAPVEVPKCEVRKPSAMPVQAPTFQGSTWEAEVQELLHRITPTPEGDAMVERIARTVQRVVAPIIPEAEVTGFASGNITGGTAFGVAVPEVDVVIKANPTALLGRLQGRWRAHGAAEQLDTQKLQKSAIRACTDRLVSTGAFKFRRSAFRGPEPKVTIIAPVGDAPGQGVPLNLSVNAVTPLYNAALLAECGRLQPRARELILLVKRWAKDRGLCHAAKGHLPPYAWTLLVIFFCQTREDEEGALLPPLAAFEACSGLMKGDKTASKAWDKEKLCATQRTTGELFKDFLIFYSKGFNWCTEAVSIRLGSRGRPEPTLPLHIVLDGESGRTEVGPSIEDPFEPTRNLGACTTSSSLAHLKAELVRAEEMCTSGVSLSRLLVPWAPPEAAGDEEEQ